MSRNNLSLFMILIACMLLVGMGSADTVNPPASITNLTNATTTCEQIIFDWDNPTDLDFGGVEYWLNDVKGSNFTSEMGSWVMFGEREAGTPYTFSTRTYDTIGNANATFVNMTAIPTSCNASSSNCTSCGYHSSAYAGFASTEVVTVGFIGLCGMLIIGLIGRKE